MHSEPSRHRLATSGRVAAITAVSAALFVLCQVLLPLTGSVPVEVGKAFAGVEPDHQILLTLRAPRVALALLTGGALALAGVLFQALLRDALATPYTLGVSAGASLGAVIAISAGWALLWPAAITGALLTLLLVIGVSARSRIVSPFTLLMAGVTLNSICMAAILFLHSVATNAQSLTITRWLMGGIEAVDIPSLTVLFVLVTAAGLYSFIHARRWNALAVGEEWAIVRGVEANRLVIGGYIAGSLLTGAVTALTGPIGFVGLIVPHALRLSLGADHRLLIPASFFLGGVFLAVCDTVARTAMSPAEIPVGVITAMIGGPFFIWILRAR
jgi:iron complex transport system permease protein